MEHQRNSDSSEIVGTDQDKLNLLKPGFALKIGGAKRTVFSLQQKEVMIEFYNRQANYGIRADPLDCISAMRERGLEPLKESQIKSWWSTYHQSENEKWRVWLQTSKTPAKHCLLEMPINRTLLQNLD